ncbi:MAG TPA: hypothetical protein VG799_06355 [Gemmatimonadota bacterium]|jgi:hypothetical protein|nr:hypothetical protein [Gemmatimonadota bacterium]
MEALTPVLWVLGLAFLTLAWLGIVLSLSMVARGVIESVLRVQERPRDVKTEGRPLSVWVHGLIAGSIGYGVVVVFYVVLNLLQGRSPFSTPTALGRSLLGTRALTDGVEIAPLLVYNGLHLVVFLVLGLAAAWLMLESGRHPKIWYLAFVLLLALFFHLVGGVVMLAGPSEGLVSVWSVVVASAIAALAMGIYLLASQPQILAAVRLADLES